MRSQTITHNRAKRMRRALTPPEVALWSQLQGGKLRGLHFRRQSPFGPYILDFYCAAAKVAVEIDGISHGAGDRPQHDARRDEWLAEQGVFTLRLPASDVRGDLLPVLNTIQLAVMRHAPGLLKS